MRVQIDIKNLSQIYHPHYNRPAPWPTWYPGIGWERSVEPHRLGIWLLENWTISFYITAAYLVAIVIGRRIMASRKPFNLKWQLTAWNTGMAFYSAMATYQVLPMSLWLIWNQGYTSYMCDIPTYRRHEMSTWLLIMGFSRIAEFGDTVFLVLRKRPIIHLHWIHHGGVVLLGFFLATFLPVAVLQAATINFSIHTYMYGYYALRSAGIRVPVKYAEWITRVQIGQFVVNFFACLWVYYIMEWTPRPCHNHPIFIYGSVFICGLFMSLFVNYFVQTYRRRNRPLGLGKPKDESGPPVDLNGNANGLLLTPNASNGHCLSSDMKKES